MRRSSEVLAEILREQDEKQRQAEEERQRKRERAKEIHVANVAITALHQGSGIYDGEDTSTADRNFKHARKIRDLKRQLKG